MRTETRTIYVSDDGREFDNDLDCRVHEKQYEIVNWLSTDPELCLNERSCDEIEMLHHKVLHLEVENKELTRRNDRQCATINELHEKIADGEELADKKARRKSLLKSILLAQSLISDIFDEPDALVDDETLPMDVLNTVNTELDLIFQRIHNLGEYVTRNL